MRLHGVLRQIRALGGGAVNEQDWRLLDADRSVEELRIGGWLLQKGDRVRLRPRARGDVFDLVLDGKTAAVESIEQDLEGNFLVVGGARGGSRRLSRPAATAGPPILLLAARRSSRCRRSGAVRPPLTRTVLVAGIGNIFLGDDGFGVEVAQRLAARPLAAGVTVVDYGIRGYDLAYALVRGCGPRHPGGRMPARRAARHRLRARARSCRSGRAERRRQAVLDAHDLNPVHVLRLARSLGATLGR